MLPIQFVYTENGKQKTSLDEHKRRCEIMEHNKRLQKQHPVYQKHKMETKWLFYMVWIEVISMSKYTVIGNLKRARKDYDGETQDCKTYDEALKVKKEWIKSNRYSEVFVERNDIE